MFEERRVLRGAKCVYREEGVVTSGTIVNASGAGYSVVPDFGEKRKIIRLEDFVSIY